MADTVTIPRDVLDALHYYALVAGPVEGVLYGKYRHAEALEVASRVLLGQPHTEGHENG